MSDEMKKRSKIKKTSEEEMKNLLSFLDCYDGVPFTEEEAYLRESSRNDLQDAAIIGIRNLYGINLERFDDMYAYVPGCDTFFSLDELVFWYELVRKPSSLNSSTHDELDDMISSLNDNTHKA